MGPLRFILVDWGTTRVRAYLVEGGTIADRVEAEEGVSALTKGQHGEVFRSLCAPWLAGASLESLPSNELIAAQLGTPGATGTVKAALRRIYAKAGLSGMPANAKRRSLCRVARQRGWI